MFRFVLALSLLVSSNLYAASQKTNPATAIIAAVKVLSNAELQCQTDQDCMAIPVGNKACGGPSDYIIASKVNQNINEIQTLARLSEDKEHIYNVENRIISNCMIEMPPKTACAKSKCIQR